MQVVTGFHAIEEFLRKAEAVPASASGAALLYAKPGPRLRKMVQAAAKCGVASREVSAEELDRLVAELPGTVRDHRGAALTLPGEAGGQSRCDFERFVSEHSEALPPEKPVSVVVVLDSVTDPHNVGAVIRSCDQFGVDLVVLPEHRGAKNSEVIARASAGASSWVPVSVVPNLVRAVERLKDAGYWVYGADAGGGAVSSVRLAGKIVLVMGSEGDGIARLLAQKCDGIVSIPTCGKLDSLNVSVAAGILLYEIRRQNFGEVR